MSLHAFLEVRIKSLEEIADVESKRRRLDQLQALTPVLQRTYKQALQLYYSILLMELVFQQKPICSIRTLKSHLQKPLESLALPKEVFTRSQTDLTFFQTRLSDSQEKIQGLTQKLERQLESFKKELKREMDTVRGLLKIPDLLPENTEAKQIEGLLNKMSTVIQNTENVLKTLGDLNATTTPDHAIENLSIQWTELYATFTNIREQLSFDRLLEPPYEFDEKTIKVIQDLIAGKTLTLDQLTPLIIRDLHCLQQFVGQVELRFTAQD